MRGLSRIYSEEGQTLDLAAVVLREKMIDEAKNAMEKKDKLLKNPESEFVIVQGMKFIPSGIRHDIPNLSSLTSRVPSRRAALSHATPSVNKTHFTVFVRWVLTRLIALPTFARWTKS